MSTIDVDSAKAIAAAVHGNGGTYIEAPISGSKGPAEQGALIFLTAGEAPLLADPPWTPALDTCLGIKGPG